MAMVVRREAAGVLLRRARRQVQLHLPDQGGRDAAHHLVLHQEDVGEVACIVLRPDYGLGVDVDQLDRQQHTLVHCAQAARDQVVDAQLGADLPDAERAVAEREGGVARDHGQRAEARQRGYDIRHDAVGQDLPVR